MDNQLHICGVFASRRIMCAISQILLIAGLSCGLAVESTARSLSISLPVSPIQFDANQNSLRHEDFNSVQLPSGMKLAMGPIAIEVGKTNPFAGATLKIVDKSEIGWIDPTLVYQEDVPTSLDDHYLGIRSALSYEIEAMQADSIRLKLMSYDNSNVLVGTFSPYRIADDGTVYQVTSIEIEFDSSAQIESPATMLGTAASEYLQARDENNRAKLMRSSGLGTEFVVVTNAELEPEMQRLAEYRGATGISTQVVLIDDILNNYTGRDGAEKLRQYLKYAYINGMRSLLLAGDETVLPVRYAYYYNTNSTPALDYQMLCDLYFADLNGEWDVDNDNVWGEPTHDSPDITAEIRVGRLPIHSAVQAKDYVDKLIMYETNPGKGDMQYLERSVIFSSDQMRDFGTIGQHGIIAEALPSSISVDTAGVLETPTGDDPNPTNLNGEESITKLNGGYGIVNILAHGRYDGFAARTSIYNSWPKSYLLTSEAVNGHGSFSALEPNGTMGLYVSLSCDLGGYDLDAPPFSGTAQSMVESVISLPLSGAVGMVAYSRWGWVYSSYLLHTAFIEHLFSDANGNPVAAMQAATADYPYYRDLIYGQNYFGDPNLVIYSQAPEKYDLAIDASDWASDFLYARVTQNGSAESGVEVYFSKDGEILTTAVSDNAGYVTFVAAFQLGEDYMISITPDGATKSVETFTPALGADVGDDGESVLPTQFALHQNYPNPFNPTTTIAFDLPRKSDVTISIVNILGQVVDRAQLGTLSAGAHEFVWDPSEHGLNLASGIYFYTFETGEYRDTKKMSLLK